MVKPKLLLNALNSIPEVERHKCIAFALVEFVLKLDPVDEKRASI